MRCCGNPWVMGSWSCWYHLQFGFFSFFLDERPETVPKSKLIWKYMNILFYFLIRKFYSICFQTDPSGFASMDSTKHLECAGQGNIHIHWKFLGGGGLQKPNILKESTKLDWKGFEQLEVQTKISSVVRVQRHFSTNTITNISPYHHVQSKFNNCMHLRSILLK